MRITSIFFVSQAWVKLSVNQLGPLIAFIRGNCFEWRACFRGVRHQIVSCMGGISRRRNHPFLRNSRGLWIKKAWHLAGPVPAVSSIKWKKFVAHEWSAKKFVNQKNTLPHNLACFFFVYISVSYLMRLYFKPIFNELILYPYLWT